MTARAARTVLAAALALAAGAAKADPIVTATGSCYAAAWIAAEGTDCNAACASTGMAAEGMKLGPSSDQDIFVCRHRGSETHGFGEQSAGTCRVGLADGFLAEYPAFECLCVTAAACPAGPTDGPPQPNFAEDCLPFDTAAISVANIGGRWKIVEGQHWMFDFADSEAEAREAFKAIHLLGANRVCYIGRPEPSMTYLKTGDRVPGGSAEDFGFDCIPFDTASVGLQQEGSQWLLFSSGSRMLMFPNEQEARNGLNAISTYGLDRHCFVGRPQPSFEFWMAR